MQKCMSDYLDDVCASIRPKALKQAVRSELADHLTERCEELCREGYELEAAAREAVMRMGDPTALGKRLTAAGQKPGQRLILVLALLTAAATMALLIAWGGGRLTYLIDLSSFIGVTVLTAAYGLLSCGGNITLPAFMRGARAGALYAGVLCVVIGVIIMMQNLDDPASLGPGVAAALVSLFYGLLFSAGARVAEHWLAAPEPRAIRKLLE